MKEKRYKHSQANGGVSRKQGVHRQRALNYILLLLQQLVDPAASFQRPDNQALQINQITAGEDHQHPRNHARQFSPLRLKHSGRRQTQIAGKGHPVQTATIFTNSYYLYATANAHVRHTTNKMEGGKMQGGEDASTAEPRPEKSSNRFKPTKAHGTIFILLLGVGLSHPSKNKTKRGGRSSWLTASAERTIQNITKTQRQNRKIGKGTIW